MINNCVDFSFVLFKKGKNFDSGNRKLECVYGNTLCERLACGSNVLYISGWTEGRESRGEGEGIENQSLHLDLKRKERVSFYYQFSSLRASKLYPDPREIPDMPPLD
jgi:hypothetical protein